MGVLVCVLVSSLAVAVAQNSECRDKVDYYTCYTWMLSGMCTDPAHRMLAMGSCRRTCNMCWDNWTPKESADNNNYSDNGEVCKDNRSTCSKWLKHCKKNSGYSDFMT